VTDAGSGGKTDDSRPVDGAFEPDGGAPLADAAVIPDAVAQDATAQDAAVVVDPDAAPLDAAPAEPDAAPACEVPALEPSPQEDWRHGFETGVLTVTQGDANHRGQDVVAVEGAPQVLIGKFAYGLADKDLKDEDVETWIEDPPCGEWTSYGIDLTSEDDEFGDRYGIHDDGGRLFLTVDPLRPFGWHRVSMVALGDESEAAFRLAVVHPRTDAVVFDIDGTLTTDDSELILELLADLFHGNHVPQMRDGGPDVARAYADRGYLIVYLTGRPDQLRHVSEQWLIDRGFPPGVVHLTDTLEQAVPSSGGVAAYKTAFLQRLQDEAQVRIFAAYGNATTDIEAYEAAGIPKERTFIVGPHAGEGNTVGLQSYVDHLPAAQAMPAAAVPAPPLTEW
jgi:hypothetical protein